MTRNVRGSPDPERSNDLLAFLGGRLRGDAIHHAARERHIPAIHVASPSSRGAANPTTAVRAAAPSCSMLSQDNSVKGAMPARRRRSRARPGPPETPRGSSG